LPVIIELQDFDGGAPHRATLLARGNAYGLERRPVLAVAASRPARAVLRTAHRATQTGRSVQRDSVVDYHNH
ncbi:MAG: hypothetical protein OXH05_11515, partial [Acidobacteria bacterium]|nr:hypothetical protein [Acidobacteriota bacterium]